MESSQGQQQHFANLGMRDTVAEQTILRGHGRANARIRAKLDWNQMDNEEREAIPAWTRGEPLSFDHLLLSSINRAVEATGSAWVPFENVQTLEEDNGEQFLATYYEEQKIRKEKVTPHAHNDRCQCLSCAMNPIPLPSRRTAESAAAGSGVAALSLGSKTYDVDGGGSSSDEDYEDYDDSNQRIDWKLENTKKVRTGDAIGAAPQFN